VSVVTAFFISLIRTWAAVLAGAIITWAAAHGLGIHDSLTAPLDALLFGVFTAAYYFVARFAETYINKYLGFLLLIPKIPGYTAPGPRMIA
jgi:hypothetical protein